MFASLFRYDSPFWRNFSRTMDVVGLTLCFWICSIPLVTVGAAATALYDSIFHGVRLGELGPYARFFSTFRRELKTALPVGLLTIAAFVLYRALFGIAYATALEGSRMAGVMVYAYRLLFCFPLAILVFACAILSRFTFRWSGLLASACRLVFAHLPSAALAALIVLVGANLVWAWPISGIFIPGLVALLISYPLERLFAPFLPKQEEEQDS